MKGEPMATIYQTHCSDVCKLEGKKDRDTIGNVREVISLSWAKLAAIDERGDLDDYAETVSALLKIGKARLRKLRKAGVKI